MNLPLGLMYKGLCGAGPLPEMTLGDCGSFKPAHDVLDGLESADRDEAVPLPLLRLADTWFRINMTDRMKIAAALV